MKRAVIVVVSILVIAIVGIVAAPAFVNWNNYKTEISEQVHKFTGRDLTIAGDISVQVLPKPRLIAEQVALSSLDGAQSPDLVSLRSVEVAVALAPLITGQVRIETVRLIEPNIYLEVLADGRSTWDITPPADKSNSPEPQATEQATPQTASSSSPAVVIDAFEIVDGNVSYSDPASGVSETVGDVDMQIAAASLTTGPYSLEGGLLIKGLRLTIDANVGTIVEGRTFPIDASLGLGGNSALINLDGTVIGLDDTPRFTGNLKVTAEDIGAVVEAFAPGTDLPSPLAQRFSLGGAIDAGATELTFADFDVNIGGSMGKGTIQGNFSGTPRITSDIQIDKIDVDPWLETTEATTKATQKPAPKNTSSDDASGAEKAVVRAEEEAAFALPDGIDVIANVRVGEISMRGDAVQNVVLSAQLARGEITLSQLTLQGPGELDIAVFGFLTAKDGVPAFDTTVDVSVADVPGLLEWAQVSTGLPAGKPANLKLKAVAKGTDKQISLQQMVLSFDKTNIVGAANVALRDRLGIGATVKVDQINVDSYLPVADQKPATTPRKTADDVEQGGDTTEEKPATATAGNPLAALAPLADIDANIKASIGTLTASGIPIKDVQADLGLLAGNLTIRNFSVANAAGVKAIVTGGLNGLAGSPEAKSLNADIQVISPSMLADVGGFTLPFSEKNLGKVAANITLNGPVMKPGISAKVDAMAAKLLAKGVVSPLELGNLFDLGFELQHPNMAAFLRRLGVDYQPAGDIGALSISSQVNGGVASVSFADLLAIVGNAKIGGDGNLRLLGARPKLTANLSTNEIKVDPFLPAKKAASLYPGTEAPKVMPARFQTLEGQQNGLLHLIAGVHPRWSTVPIDLTGLGAIDADVTLKSPGITYDTYRLKDANMIASLKNQVLTVKDFTGSVFEGAFQSSAVINAAAVQPQISGLVTLGNMDIGEASKAAGGPNASGKLTTRLEVATLGNSVADYVSTLAGKGAIQVDGIKGDAAIADMPVVGLALGPLLRIFELLNSGLGVFAKTGLGQTNVTSTFVIENGIIKTEDTRMLSNIYDGNLAGSINLPQWTMGVGGKVALDQGVIGGLLANVVRIPSEIPFEVTGNIDKPNVKIQSIGSGGSGGVQIPGLDKLEKKAPGVGGLIQGILGGGSSGSSGSSSSGSSTPPAQDSTSEPPAQQPPAQQQPSNPAEKLLRGLLGG